VRIVWPSRVCRGRLCVRSQRGFYLSGIDAVEAADEDLKNWPPEQRVTAQSADDFRKGWQEDKAQAEEFWANKKPPPG
jgi:hypothetical protein